MLAKTLAPFVVFLSNISFLREHLICAEKRGTIGKQTKNEAICYTTHTPVVKFEHTMEQVEHWVNFCVACLLFVVKILEMFHPQRFHCQQFFLWRTTTTHQTSSQLPKNIMNEISSETPLRIVSLVDH